MPTQELLRSYFLQFLPEHWPYLSKIFDPEGIFLLTVFGTLTGTVFGAWAIIWFERSRKQEETLASLNYMTVCFISLLNRLVNIKKQLALPLKKEVEDITARFIEARLRNLQTETPTVLHVHLEEITNSFHQIDFEFFVSIKDLGRYSNLNSRALMYALEVQNALKKVAAIMQDKNALTEEMKSVFVRDPDSWMRYLGLVSRDGHTDVRLIRMSDNFCKCVDDTLFFLIKALSELEKLSKKSLQKRFLKRYVGYSIPDQYKMYLPPNNHLSGW